MRFLLASGICLAGFVANPSAQVRNPPVEFNEFRGTWTLDETATQGLIQLRPGLLLDRIGFSAARTLVLTTTPTAISVSKDGGAPEVYRVDGIDRPVRDERTGAYLNISHRFTLVAGMLVLTRGAPVREDDYQGVATIITDAYRVDGAVLTVERQHSVVVRPDGHLATLANQPRRSTLVYRLRAGQ